MYQTSGAITLPVLASPRCCHVLHGLLLPSFTLFSVHCSVRPVATLIAIAIETQLGRRSVFFLLHCPSRQLPPLYCVVLLLLRSKSANCRPYRWCRPRYWHAISVIIVTIIIIIVATIIIIIISIAIDIAIIVIAYYYCYCMGRPSEAVANPSGWYG